LERDKLDIHTIEGRRTFWRLEAFNFNITFVFSMFRSS